MMHVFRIENMEYRNNTICNQEEFLYLCCVLFYQQNVFLYKWVYCTTALKTSGILSDSPPLNSASRYYGFWVFSGRNWISLPRCCFSHGIILNRSMWKSRASGGGLLLLYLPRAELWPDRSQTSMMPQLTTPTLEMKAGEMFTWSWFHWIQKGFC